MKRLFLLAFVLLLGTVLKVKAQKEIDTIVDLDVLAVPNSPAFTLLGVSPSDVDKPATITDFAISIANASDNLSQFPSNYALEFLPFKMIKPDKINSIKFFTDNSFGNNLIQTFTISTGFATDDAIDTSVPGYIKTRSGTGFKFALLRGKIDEEFEGYRTSLAETREALSNVHTLAVAMADSIRANDTLYLHLTVLKDSIIRELVTNVRDTSINQEERNIRSSLFTQMLNMTTKAIEERFDERKRIVIDKKEGELYDQGQVLKKKIESIKFRRYGALLDFAGGLVLGFRDNDFQNSIVQQYAFWFNGGYSCKKGFDIMGVARYATAFKTHVDENGNLADDNIFDAGVKSEFRTHDEKLLLSLEFLGRFLSDTVVYRYTFNASYQVGKNQALTFSIGKAFNGIAQYGGNLIAALNYARSFGSKRKIVPTASDN